MVGVQPSVEDRDVRVASVSLHLVWIEHGLENVMLATDKLRVRVEVMPPSSAGEHDL